jgi:hypothetical protein
MEAAFRAWWQESYGLPPGPHAVMTHVAWGEHLLATRPKPPSLKEQALARLTSLEELAESMGHSPDDTIRRALEQLND